MRIKLIRIEDVCDRDWMPADMGGGGGWIRRVLVRECLRYE